METASSTLPDRSHATCCTVSIACDISFSLELGSRRRQSDNLRSRSKPSHVKFVTTSACSSLQISASSMTRSMPLTKGRIRISPTVWRRVSDARDPVHHEACVSTLHQVLSPSLQLQIAPSIVSTYSSWRKDHEGLRLRAKLKSRRKTVRRKQARRRREIRHAWPPKCLSQFSQSDRGSQSWHRQLPQLSPHQGASIVSPAAEIRTEEQEACPRPTRRHRCTVPCEPLSRI